MLSERYVSELTISWIKRPNDDDFALQIDDMVSVSTLSDRYLTLFLIYQTFLVRLHLSITVN